MILLSTVVVIYVASGGLKSVAYVDCAQAILLALGIVILGVITISFIGGWDLFILGIGDLVKNDLLNVKDQAVVKVSQESFDNIVSPSEPEGAETFHNIF